MAHLHILVVACLARAFIAFIIFVAQHVGHFILFGLSLACYDYMYQWYCLCSQRNLHSEPPHQALPPLDVSRRRHGAPRGGRGGWRHGKVAREDKLLNEILRIHYHNEENRFKEVYAREGVIGHEILRAKAKRWLNHLVGEGHDVFYISVGGEHKVREHTRRQMKRKNLKSHVGSMGEVHANIFPSKNRHRVMRSARARNSERFECVLINTALEYERKGLIKKVINTVNPRTGVALMANLLERGYCDCSLYSEVWVSVTKMEKFDSDGYEFI